MTAIPIAYDDNTDVLWTRGHVDKDALRAACEEYAESELTGYQLAYRIGEPTHGFLEQGEVVRGTRFFAVTSKGIVPCQPHFGAIVATYCRLEDREKK